MRYLSVFLVVLVMSTMYGLTPMSAQEAAMGARTKSDAEVNAVMRMIGHEVLKSHGDATSRVLPIQKEGDAHVIQFDTKFVFQAVKLAGAVDMVIQEQDLALGYLVEMQDCLTKSIIHSYQVSGVVDVDAIPCGVRAQPEACYNLRLTILDNEQAEQPLPLLEHAGMSPEIMWAMSIILTVGLLFFVYQKPSPIAVDPNLVSIGAYQFNPQKMLLSNEGLSVTLTSKESDLLGLLHGSVNATISRDDILHHVWGDKGDYVGRTLDVFISKLRKKLEADPNIKIANIRGVGYRLVV